MDDDARRALDISPASTAAERTVEITTTGAKTGRRIRIEIWLYGVEDELYLSRTPGLPQAGWVANLLASPGFVLHLKNGAQGDLQATASAITDAAERKRVFAAMVEDLSQPSNPAGLSTPPKPVERWLAGSPLFRVELS